MLELKLIVIDSSLMAMYFDDIFQRHIKVENVEDVVGKIINSDYRLIQKNNYEFSIDVPKNKLPFFKRDLIFEANKQKIDLPETLECSYETNRLVTFSYRSLSHFSNYWLISKQSSGVKGQIFTQLSQDIFENPYIDTPTDYEYRNNMIAFHPNHGSLQAIRMSLLTNAYLRIIKLKIDSHERLSAINKVLLTITEEEQSCLELAAFLFRSGRTNELSWKGDPSYSPRSMAIFTQIAIELGYNEKLVSNISSCFDFDLGPDLNYGSNDLGEPSKLKLYRSLLRLAHTSDLIRCNTNLSWLRSIIVDELHCFLKDGVVELADLFLSFAALLCKETGAPVVTSELQINQEYSVRGNRYKLVYSTKNLNESYRELCLLLEGFCDPFVNTICKMPRKSSSLNELHFFRAAHGLSKSSKCLPSCLSSPLLDNMCAT